MMKAALLLIGVTAVAGDCVLQPGYHLVPSVKNVGDLTCKPCPRSTYGIRNFSHTNPEDMFQCIPCEPGTFNLVEGSVECHSNKCADGQMRITGGKPDGTDSCFTCPVGGQTDAEKYTTDGAGKCVCAAGTEMKENKCVLCPAMHYQDEPNQGYCKQCPVGEFQFEQGASSCLTATCGPGQYLRKTPGGAKYAHECTACPDNHVAAGTALRFECEVCPFGKYANADKSACLENTCTTGKFRNSSGACKNCEIGEYQDHDGAVDCKACPTGSTTSHAGAVSASACKKSCAAGEQSVHGSCQKCAVGKFSSSGQTYCELCPKGRWSFNTGSTSCTMVSECTAGQYTDPSFNGADPSSNQCLNCPKGKYTPTDGMHFCRTCPENHYAWSDGLSSCTGVSCDIGSFKETSASTTCTLCPEGKFQDRRNKVTCNTCPEGKYQFTPGQATCIDMNCQAGSYKASSSASCLPCEANTFSTRDGSIGCTSCPAGRYGVKATGNTECAVKVCAPGKKVVGHSCDECPANEFSASRGTQTSCTPCPAGTTTDSLTGQSACWKAEADIDDTDIQVNYHVCGDHLSTSDLPLKCSWSNVTTTATTGVVPDFSPGWHFVLRVTHRDSNNNGYGNSSTGSWLRPLQKHKCGMVLLSSGYTCRCWCWTDHATTAEGHTFHTDDLDGSNGHTNPTPARPQWNPATESAHYGQTSRVNLNNVEFKQYTWNDLQTHTKSAFYEKYKNAV